VQKKYQKCKQRNVKYAKTVTSAPGNLTESTQPKYGKFERGKNTSMGSMGMKLARDLGSCKYVCGLRLEKKYIQLNKHNEWWVGHNWLKKHICTKAIKKSTTPRHVKERMIQKHDKKPAEKQWDLYGGAGGRDHR